MSSPGSGVIESSSRSTSDSRELSKWQRRLLPYMTRFLVLLAIGFFGLCIYDVYETRSFVSSETSERALLRIEQLLDPKAGAQPSSRVSIDLLQQSLLLLEADAMDKRYRQASALLMSRIWTRQLAFLTGMVLAFIGAVFILGKLAENKTDVSLGAEQWKGAISSTSPGLILASFGTLLITVSLIVQPNIEVQDRPIYFVTMGVVRNPNASADKLENSRDKDAGPINPGLGEH
jgi:hypothetical protein